MCSADFPPTLAVLNAFSLYGANLKGITLDEDGMKTMELEETIIKLKKSGKKIKFIYVIPDFQNPSGITLTEERRLEIIRDR